MAGVLIKGGNSNTESDVHTRQADMHLCGDQDTCLQAEKREASEGTNPADTLIWDFPPLEPGDKKSELFKPPSLW